MFVIAIIYLFFPNNDLSLDSIDYACSIKYGKDLFQPHHLLYNFIGYHFYTLFQYIIPQIDAYKLMQLLNAIIALISLFILRKIIKQITDNQHKANVWTFFVASSFAVMRYSVENETYIIPIFFSLLSSLYYLKYLKTEKLQNVLWCSLFASLACLFHQVQLFWGIGLFIGFLSTRKIKPILLFSIPTLIVLVVYSITMVYDGGRSFTITHLIHFLLDYYYSANADTHMGSVNFVLTPISLFRTFFQVHGLIANVLQLIPAFYLVIPVVIGFIALSIFKAKGIKFQGVNFKQSSFELTHFFIFILQIVFAFFSHGNAKFMVMLPFLLPLFIYLFFKFDLKCIKYMAFAMLIWNFFFAIFPNHYFDYQNDKELISVIKQHPNNVFLLKEKNKIALEFYYTQGVEIEDKIMNNKKEDIQTYSAQKKTFYTDVLTKKMPFSREDIASPSDYSNIVFVKHIQHINSTLGGYYIDEIKFVDKK
jgi:hypothetical protein